MTNFSVHPLAAYSYQNYTFYVCPEERVGRGFRIPCLSNSTNATVVTMADSSEYFGCKPIVSSMIPVSLSGPYDDWEKFGYLELTWNFPPCKHCELHDDIDPEKPGDTTKSKFVKLIFGSSVFIPLATIFITLFGIACFIRILKLIVGGTTMDNTATGNSAEDSATTTVAPPQASAGGPHGTTSATPGTETSKVEIFSQVVVLGESHVDKLMICSICLEEYNGKDRISAQTPTCSNNTFFIQYPFKLLQEGQNPHHISPYDLKCSRQGIVVLNLPFSGEFYVRNIDYFEQTIQLYDPGNCLPGRLKNLSLSSSPFLAVSYQNYTFFSCPPEIPSSRNFTAISCLSNSTDAVVATSAPSMVDEIRNSTGCKVIYSLQIPISPAFEYVNNGIGGDLQLSWIDSNSKGNIRGKTSSKPGALTITLVCAITISTALLVALFCVGCSLSVIVILDSGEENYQRCWSFRTRFWGRGRIRLYSAQQQPQPSATRRDDEVSFMSSASAAPLGDFSVMSSTQVPGGNAASLDESSSTPGVTAAVHSFDYPPTPSSSSVAAADSYGYDDFSVMPSPEAPSVVAAAHDDEFFFDAAADEELPTEDLIIGGSRCISGPNGDSCPICLGGYKASERLRLIRKCQHCFHADCLEPWLQRKNTCPICRTDVI
ncbi:hypothetical protein C2S52_011213 [Perilla frutescens var. hirtella]|nr:hypothetical protein C2S52_011213 [Perilla frutescens var. hirtella]